MPKMLLIALSTLLLHGHVAFLLGQVGRASITGIVRDPTAAVVAGVSVKARHVETGVLYEATSNEVGAYTLGALPIGEYAITYTAPGFKEFTRGGIMLASAQIARIDPTLEVGQVQESLTVTAEATLLKTETSQASETVNSSVFTQLPLSFGGQGRNMAVFADKLVPGVRGSSYTMSIQGNPGASAGILIDGMTNLAGFLPGDFGEASVSPEAVQELTVLTGNVTAEQGRQSGGTLNFTLKSGTNRPHGAVFYYLRNEVLNANNWNNNLYLAADPNFTKSTTSSFKRPLDRRKDYGFTFGGPVYIPKLYNGRDRTFFQVTMERFNTATQGPGSLSWSVPQPEMWNGNLSRLLTGNQVGVDALGRTVFEGQIYDPTTLRQVNGRYVADPFQGNIIPVSMLSTVAKNFGKVFNEWYQPVNSSITNNMFTPTQNRQDVKQYTVKIDHTLGVKHKFSGYYYKHGFPRNFQENVSEIWSLKDPDLGGPLSRSIRQQRRGYSWNGGYDWMASPTILSHFTVGLNNNGNAFRSRQVGKSFADSWGIKGIGLGAPDEQVTRPVISLGGSPVATFQSWNHDANRDEFYRSVILGETVSWQRGSHTLKFGIEWNFLRYDSQQFNNTGGTFNFAARTTAIPGESYTSRIGNSFASFLLGQVDSSTLGPIFNPITTRHYGGIRAGQLESQFEADSQHRAAMERKLPAV
jgi:Carboxypeptidase regulatory-like domain